MPFSGPMKLAPRCLGISTFETVRGVHPHLSVHHGGKQQRCFGVAPARNDPASSICWLYQQNNYISFVLRMNRKLFQPGNLIVLVNCIGAGDQAGGCQPDERAFDKIAS
jgi:hypothetical protein